jgi:hypothetical protein
MPFKAATGDDGDQNVSPPSIACRGAHRNFSAARVFQSGRARQIRPTGSLLIDSRELDSSITEAHDFKRGRAMPARQCPHCGKEVFDQLTQCPYCREAIAALPRVHGSGTHRGADGGKIRQGLLCMLLAAIIHYFAGGYSAMQLPYPIQPIVTIYLSPLLFLSGVGLCLFGFFTQRTA